MDDLVRNAIKQAETLKRKPDSTPWKADQPWAQPCYSWLDEQKEWRPVTASQKPFIVISTVVVYSWNIDFMLPCPDTRVNAALAYLQGLANQLLSDPNAAVIINLQECVSSDLVTISQKQWVRDSFYMTDIDVSTWASGAYGTLTLVDRRLDITSCFRVHYSKTHMEREALFVDVPYSHGKKLRLCNTHLESLAREPPLRPAQMQVIASYMHAEEVSGAIVTGDFNAIQPFDMSLHSDNDLKDAYLELGGREDTDEGYTWGQQALPELRKLYGCSRMDKVYYCGGDLKLLGFERFGADVEISEEQKDQRDQVLSLGFEKAWVTDHLGVKAVFGLTGNLRL
ncbi:hypothetical protein UA08_00680 [Talaromyces atroroseus]|uniref:Endonuclease/exonuclease/phosphatase domain-containing protein n=1 Tax=Talaromyces atroroseus TaxID=1441469 RepID=A0A225B0W3_TALAT|nr:hypothetical protein UA08_00680 [Talaromyces atroroseus]OKL64344.1 hypothetical protein UA08_00680 [Talaromyces atroroseus]